MRSLRKAERKLKQLRNILTIPGIVLAVVAAVIAASYFIMEPSTVRVAVPADNPTDQRLMRAAAETFDAQRAAVRLKLVPAADAKEATAALEAGRADLAVLRSDMTELSQAQAVMIVRREAAIILAPKSGKVQKITDLAQANVGVVAVEKNAGLLAQVLEFYKLAYDGRKQIALAPDEVAAALQQKRVDAVLVVGAPTSRLVSDVVSEAARGARELVFVPVEEARAIARRAPALEEVEVEKGAFGGGPPRPAEDLTTIGYAIRLVAAPRLDQDTVADLTRQLVAARQNLSATVPAAGLMETPDTDDNNSFVIHPGVKAYVDGDRNTLFDRYGDWLYFILFAASGLGSAVAVTFGWFQTQRRNEALASILKIEHVLDAVRGAKSEAELAELERQADDIFRIALAKAAGGELGDTQILTFEMAMQDARMRMAAQRLALSGKRSSRTRGGAPVSAPSRERRRPAVKHDA
jgi:TRAP-type uncharacterized transport system substrate-binding protein